MVKALVAAAICWPLVLASAVWAEARGGPSVFTAIVSMGSSAICHQRPERSFSTAGVVWPVCGRCSGLYLAAPFGAIVALGTLRRRLRDRARLWLVVAALPTIVTLALEWTGAATVTNLQRFLAALPIGAAIAFVIVRTAGGPRAIGYTDVR